MTIDRRYRGPRTSANGGYAAGLLGSRLGVAAQVTLRLPPPLERALTVRRDGERLLLEDGDVLVAEATPGDPDVTPPTPPAAAVAQAACGRRRRVGAAGLRRVLRVRRARRRERPRHPSPARSRVGDGLVATTWLAHDVTPEVVWAAIDCPGAYAAGDPSRARWSSGG